MFIVAIIALAQMYVSDWAERLMVIITALLFYVAVQQAVSAKNSAVAASISATAAKESQQQATYIHLASLWYEIKQLGVESDDFIKPEFTSLFRPEEILEEYRRYHVYAWMCWGHAEDCYLKGFRSDEGFLPSIQNYKELHYAWLLVPKNRQMFNKSFLSWIDSMLTTPTVEVKEGKTHEGKEVIAKQKLQKGEFIGFFEGEPVKNRTKMSLQFAQDFHIEPSVNTIFRRLNHSCDANAYFRGRNLYAWTNIHIDEQITIDYNCTELELDSEFECNCGSTGCVGRIKGFSSLAAQQKTSRKERTCSWLRDSPEQQLTENS